MHGRLRCRAACAVWLAAGWAAAAAAGEIVNSLDTTNGVTLTSYHAEDLQLTVVTDDKQEGQGAVRVDFSSGANPYGNAGIEVRIPETNLKGKTLSVRVKNLTPETCASTFIALMDSAGKRAEMRAYHQLKGWRKLTFPVGEKGAADHYEQGAGADLTKIVAVRCYTNTRGTQQKASVLWDDLHEVTDPAEKYAP